MCGGINKNKTMFNEYAPKGQDLTEYKCMHYPLPSLRGGISKIN
jgi:hypothetical protein